MSAVRRTAGTKTDGSVVGEPAERIVVDPEADVNTVIYVGTQVKQDPCIIALPANVYAREYVTAASLMSVGGVAVPSYATTAGGVGVQVVGLTDPVTKAITLGGGCCRTRFPARSR